jgi:thioredoxin 1
MLLTGCDLRTTFSRVLSKAIPPNKNAAPTEPVPAPESAGLRAGQTPSDAEALLGDPSAILTRENRTILLYGTIQLEFVDGRLTRDEPDLTTRLQSSQIAAQDEAARRAAAQPAAQKNTKQNTTAPKGYVVKNEQGQPVDHSGLLVPGSVTVIDFYADWCGPCNMMAPILNQIIAENPGAVLRKVNIQDWNSDTAKRYAVHSVPNVRVFDRQGRMVGQPSHVPDDIQRQIKTALAQ